jgi:HEAT repeat protein
MPSNSTPPSGERLNPSLLEEIWRNECLLDAMCDSRRLETHTAVAVAQQMMGRYHNFDTRLVTELMALPDVAAGKDHRIERCLEILDAVSSGRRIIMPMMQLMNSENQRVRSKVARILGSRVENLTWTRKFLSEVDDRTRANIIESLWRSDSPKIREVFQRALQDESNRVRGNAILALYRLGDSSVLPAIRALAESREPNWRATGAWVMGATGDLRFRGLVNGLRQDSETVVRAAALRALVQLKKSEGVDGQTNLEPLIWFCEDLEGVRRVGFDLAETGVAAPRGLFPTDVVITQNGELVWDYALLERDSGPVSALFLIFDGQQPEEFPGLMGAFVECLEHKDISDRWSVVRMAAGPEGDFDEQRMVPPPYQGLKLKNALSRFKTLPRIKTEDLFKVLRLLGTQGPGRHLVLLLTPSELSDENLESLEAAALTLQFSVDIISFSSAGNEQLRRVARKTAGVFTIAPGGALAPASMIRTYASMVHRYEVNYPLTGSVESAFEITVAPPARRSAAVRNAATGPNTPAE